MGEPQIEGQGFGLIFLRKPDKCFDNPIDHVCNLNIFFRFLNSGNVKIIRSSLARNSHLLI